METWSMAAGQQSSAAEKAAQKSSREGSREGRQGRAARQGSRAQDSRKVQTTPNNYLSELTGKIITCFRKHEVQTMAMNVTSQLNIETHTSFCKESRKHIKMIELRFDSAPD